MKSSSRKTCNASWENVPSPLLLQPSLKLRMPHRLRTLQKTRLKSPRLRNEGLGARQNLS